MQAGSLFVKIALHDRNVPLGPFDNLEMQLVAFVECGSFGLGGRSAIYAVTSPALSPVPTPHYNGLAHAHAVPSPTPSAHAHAHGHTLLSQPATWLLLEDKTDLGV